jgi:hypothetical protein
VPRPSGSFAAQIGFLPICRTRHFDYVGSTPTLWGWGENHMAERVGFEPTLRRNRKPDFESGAFDHSATSPEIKRRRRGD